MIGKSQTVLGYPCRHLDDYSGVFWVDGSNSSTISDGGIQVLESLISHLVANDNTNPDHESIAASPGMPGKTSTEGLLVMQLQKPHSRLQIF